jgi:hypothetical protein
MVAAHLCSLCRPVALLPGMEGHPPSHCAGRSDHVIPGVLGGYRCSCECRHQQPTGQGMQAPAGGESPPQRAQREA